MLQVIDTSLREHGSFVVVFIWCSEVDWREGDMHVQMPPDWVSIWGQSIAIGLRTSPIVTGLVNPLAI